MNRIVNFFLIIIILLTIFFLTPIFHGFSFSKVLNFIEDGGCISLLRSIIYSFSITAVIVVIGFCCGVYLKDINRNLLYIFVGLLILPALMGNTITAYIFSRIGFIPDSLEHRPYFLTLLMIGILDIWQFSTLFIYLFWLRLQFIPKNKMVFSEYPFGEPHLFNVLINI